MDISFSLALHTNRTGRDVQFRLNLYTTCREKNFPADFEMDITGGWTAKVTVEAATTGSKVKLPSINIPKPAARPPGA